MRHRFHSICPYFAMFPEAFAAKHLCVISDDAVVLDPFSGRGTTVFQALLSGRTALGIDINPVAVCVSRAKANPPTAHEVRARLEQLESSFVAVPDEIEQDEFFKICFSKRTLEQILWLRKELDWRGNRVDCFIAAMTAGCLHGESHRSRRVLSNRMPRTIATKPAYSIRWWKEHGYMPPDRNVFAALREEAEYRFVSSPANLVGIIVEGDARAAADLLPAWHSRVDAVITSPPYLDVTHFREDQWLRVWFLGGDPKPCSATLGDDRHFNEASYWAFLEESWLGIAPLLKKDARIVIRIGGSRVNEDSVRYNLQRTLSNALKGVTCRELVISEIRKGQLRSFRPNADGTRREFDLVYERCVA